MACSNCSPEGCGNKGHCSSGGCNKMNTYDWISTLDINDPELYQYIEVSFNNGARKDFYLCDDNIYQYHTGDTVVVECSPGYDVGTISLMGDLVRAQMKKKNVHEDRIHNKISRKTNERDLEKLQEARHLNKHNLIRARAIARTLGVDMKVGDIEYQADLKKATFYYTANGRIDFRELVKDYAREFRVKIEMRQIGSRQESSRIGGIGSCGRELCCSTWLSDFRSVNTSAARYQNISINQTKLSGQCGRLKCCLNYELDTYLDALKSFPERADYLMTQKGKAVLMKTDIFKGLLFYSYEDIAYRGVFHPLDKEKVKEIQVMNKKGVYPDDLVSFYELPEPTEEEKEMEYEDLTGVIELPVEKRTPSKNRKSNKGRQASDKQANQNQGDRPNRPNNDRRSNKPKPSNRNTPSSASPSTPANNENGGSAKTNKEGDTQNSNPNRSSNNKSRRFKNKKNNNSKD